MNCLNKNYHDIDIVCQLQKLLLLATSFNKTPRVTYVSDTTKSQDEAKIQLKLRPN